MTFVVHDNDDEVYIAHYGILKKSGRYPWGSGTTPLQRSRNFTDLVSQMREKGLTDPEIAKGFGMTTTEFRNTRSIANAEKKAADVAQARRLKDKQWSNMEIARKMNRNESSIRALLAEGEQDKANILKATSDMLRRQVEEKGFVDVGAGNELHIGISTSKLTAALSILKNEGYVVEPVQVDQLGARNKTTVRVLAKPGTTYRDIKLNQDKIQLIREVSDDGGRSFFGMLPPKAVSSKRIDIVYKEQGGDKADGVIYVRPGKKDLSMEGARYAQVRIAVDGTHYLKGMAMYKDDLPDGVDLQFNTNKSDTGNKKDAMKKMSDDPDNPFGSVVRQIGKKDALGNVTEVTSAMNIVNEEGKWDDWSRNLSSQFLSKQTPTLAKQQLNQTIAEKQKDLDEILTLTNPAVRRKLLESYADDADASAVHLKAAQMPRQRTQVILPMNTMKPTEVYAPNFNDGENVVLVRFPHGGTFEIPELVVNNKNPTAKRMLGDAQDAIGINYEVAKRLSGADFDGDTVLVIPNPAGRGAVRTRPPLEKLKDFDPQHEYPAYEGMPKMKSRTKGTEMGKVSNLITDMTIKGASPDELARAVRHSMVVIDAEKHHLNYKKSAQDHGIEALQRKYQPRDDGRVGGSATLISKRKGDAKVLDRRLRRASEGGPINPQTGEKEWVYSGKTRTVRKVNKRTGEVTEKEVPILSRMPSTKLAEAKDAHTLSSGTPIEAVYADHSNRLKALANTARKESLMTKDVPYSPTARKVYKNEVDSLTAKLDAAVYNKPLERRAQLFGNATLKAKREANPDMDHAEEKKIKAMALKEARLRFGAGKPLVVINEKEWEAIQAGALTSNRLKDILDNADLDVVKSLATPRAKPTLATSKAARAEQLIGMGKTQAEVAKILGISLSTLKSGLKGE